MAPFIPLKARIQLGLFSFVSGRAIGSDDRVNRRLLSWLEPLVPADPNTKAGVCSADVMIDSTRDLFVRIFVPSDPSNGEKSEKLPLVVYFHGGGFAFFSPQSAAYDDWGRRMCSELHVVIVSVNYRRSPENRCPEPYDDGIDVLRFLDSGGLRSVDILSGFDVSLGSCFLAGDTAGGNIVHHVARRWAAKIDSWEKININGAIPITPMFGGEKRTDGDIQNQNLPVLTMQRMDWYWKVILPEGADRNHEFAHPFGATTKLEERFPPVLVVAAGYDILRDWQLKYYEWLNEMQHNVRLVMFPDSFHAFYLSRQCEEWMKLIDEMKKFVEEHRSL
ncbi:alpha/beta-Hydrolases superfamily protein [Rhynchospora pubera]|uniref:Alpha/beta-Hydrolases superfamily protein n=1 Tax=Rhynchospora pubera TaxID=906938 RepID=A0AAV8HE77_9POAL|nr:alpha/beta-Hydrolases superfamily protein [Rhynchospora pubera]KAJ4814242.1 alpha/beta-Hydrolases superfamily protein [Rhynchospora pubera]